MFFFSFHFCSLTTYSFFYITKSTPHIASSCVLMSIRRTLSYIWQRTYDLVWLRCSVYNADRALFFYASSSSFIFVLLCSLLLLPWVQPLSACAVRFLHFWSMRRTNVCITLIRDYAQSKQMHLLFVMGTRRLTVASYCVVCIVHCTHTQQNRGRCSTTRTQVFQWFFTLADFFCCFFRLRLNPAFAWNNNNLVLCRRPSNKWTASNSAVQ